MAPKAHPQDEVHAQSLSPTTQAAFWARQAAHLVWAKPPSPSAVVSTTTVSLQNSNSGRNGGGADAVAESYDSHAWFGDGEISTCYNCVDRHVDEGRGANVAVYYDSPVTAVRSTLTYAQLRDEVALLAGVLRRLGVKQGDVVMIYSTSLPVVHVLLTFCSG